LNKIANRSWKLLDHAPELEKSLFRKRAWIFYNARKVNPTQCEALTMVLRTSYGNDVAISVGECKDIMNWTFSNHWWLQISCNQLDCWWCLYVFDEHCAQGIEPNYKQELVDNSLMVVTFVSNWLLQISWNCKTAHKNGATLKKSCSFGIRNRRFWCLG
jgi:fumarate hydratase class II